jgi:hypothetical protein
MLVAPEAVENYQQMVSYKWRMWAQDFSDFLSGFMWHCLEMGFSFATFNLSLSLWLVVEPSLTVSAAVGPSKTPVTLTL